MTTASINVSDIIDSIKNSEGWEESNTLNGIKFNSWGCTFVSVTGTPKSEAEEPEDNKGDNQGGEDVSTPAKITLTVNEKLPHTSDDDGMEVICSSSDASVAALGLVDGVKKVVFNFSVSSDGWNWGWSNGVVAVQFGDETTVERKFGGTACAGNEWFPADSVVYEESDTSFSVEIAVSDFNKDDFKLLHNKAIADAYTLTTVDFIYKEDSSSDQPETPAESTSVVLSEETQVMASDWSSSLQIPAAKFADITSAGKIVVTVTDVASGAQYGLRTGEWANINDYDDVIGTSYEYAVDDTLLATLKASGLIVSGHDYTVTKVEYVTSGSGSTVTPPSTGDDNNNDDNNNNDPEPTPAAPTTVSPSETNYPVVIPVGYTPATADQIADTIGSTADGDTASVNLTGNTTVEKAVLESMAGKDITAEFKLTGGVTWEIKGTDIEKAKKVDLGVRLRSKIIPAEKIAEVAGENKTVQFSLRHNGDFGFKGVLIMPFSTKYNGQYANLYYYNKAKDSLDFVGSSKISGGKASFVFTHASDYVVVIDDTAYGEDVSSAAGVFETASEASEAPYAAIVLAAAVLGAAVIVIRKRLAK